MSSPALSPASSHDGSFRSASILRQSLIPYSKDGQTIISTKARRGAFVWLPVFFSTDLEHASWWFVLGSIVFTFIPLVDILDGPKTTQKIVLTFLYMISGVGYTIGSFLFVRAFREPMPTPVCPTCTHCITDELFGAWIFLLGTLPYIPYFVLYIVESPTDIFWWLGLGGAVLVCIGLYGFVITCYPNASMRDGARIASCLKACFGCHCGRHFSNDWIASCWLLFICSVLFTLVVFAAVFKTARDGDYKSCLSYSLDCICSIMYTIGCMYFVSGSYPVNFSEDGSTAHASVNHTPSFQGTLSNTVSPMADSEAGWRSDQKATSSSPSSSASVVPINNEAVYNSPLK